ncbi:pyruvate dehydrogenase E1 component subunit beta [Spiroplasma sp. TIUS-1]|uniref:alpha-ketoacid dehydrogenase subunit beta n=1 Tax=Spiroplasma sp. TIUS-1 TaxID=216963 RepID=UPI001398860E|nr:alpha-ketoacid dehydrogenase subunit beta [Spiroplasma sp. TIUS-1]QHX35656.1 pyruvate dehydrogenase E1 component subunit beta [Spiroplasma sp. TIUS-1]
MSTINNIKAVAEGITATMKKWDNVIIYGEDVGYEGGVFRATQGIQKEFGEERCFDAPISEALFAGMAIGMAMNGVRPIVEIQFQGLGWASLQNILGHVGRMRNRTRGKYFLPMVIRMPMGGGIRSLELHSEAMEVIYAHLPGVKVVCPSTPYDTKGLICAAVESNDPVIILEPTKLYRAFKQEVPDEFYTVPIGEGYKISEGSDITVVTYGAQTVDCQKAVEMLKVENPGVGVDLIDLRSIKPWDKKMVFESVKKTGRLVVVHEAVKSFSISSEIIASVQEECFEYLKAPLARCTGYDVVIPFDSGEKYFHINPYRVLEQMKKTLGFKF